MRPEEKIEKKFVSECAKIGVTAYKFEVPGIKGAPDRIMFLPGGITLFVEFKEPGGGTLSKHQINFINRLQRLGFEVHVATDWETPLKIVKELNCDYIV